jgi:hypothetical protein
MLPNSTGQQRVGVDPIQNQQQNNTNQKLAEILDSFQSRLDNVLNVRTEVQSATFSAFGNNFLTRGLTQLSDSITDSISSLFSKPEAEKEDPVLAQLKVQTATLERLADSNLQGSDKMVTALEDGFTSLRIDQKYHRQATRDESEHQVDLLSDILRALEDTTTMPASPSAGGRDQTRMYDDIIDVEEVTPTNESSNLPRIGNDVTDVETRENSETPKTEEFQKDQKEKTSKTLKTLTDIHDKLSRLVSTIEISTQESDSESLRSMQDRDIVSDVEDGQRAPSAESFLERLFKGLGDIDANKLGFMKVFTKIFSSLKSAILPAIALITSLSKSAIPLFTKALGAVKAGIMSVVTKIPGLLKGLVAGATNLISKIPFSAIGRGLMSAASVAGKGLLGAAKFVAPAVAVVGAGAAGYYAGTKLNEAMEGTAVGEAKDAAFDAMFSGIDKVTGGGISGNPRGLDAPAPVPEKADTTASTLQVIEENQKAAREKDRVKSDKPASVVVQDNSVKTQQTIMPARANVMNVDASYNRYMDTAFLATGRR